MAQTSAELLRPVSMAVPRGRPKVARAGRWLRLGIVALGVTTAASLLARHAWLLDLLTFAQQHLAVLAAIFCTLALFLRMPAWALTAAGMAVLNVHLLLAAGSPAAMPTTDGGQRLKVLSLNLLGQNYYGGRVSRFLRQTAADVVVLQENSPFWSEKLAALRDLYPHAWPPLEPFNSDVVVLSRYPLPEAERLSAPTTAVGADWARPLRVVVDLGEARVALYAVHPETPRSSWQWRMRNDYLAWIGETARSRDQGQPRLIVGDFNTPPTSPFLDDLRGAAGVRDTAGSGLRRPTRQPMLGAPYLSWLGAPVDHILASPDIAVERFDVGRHVESDHLPIMAELRLPTEAARAHVSGASPAR